jgi:hypothetical protein
MAQQVYGRGQEREKGGQCELRAGGEATTLGCSYQGSRATQRFMAIQHRPIDGPDVESAHACNSLYVSCCSSIHAARSPHPPPRCYSSLRPHACPLFAL